MTSSLSRYFDAVDIDERMEQMLSSRFATPFDRSTTLWNQSVIRRHPFHLVRDGEKVESFLKENNGNFVRIGFGDLRGLEGGLTA